MRLLIILRLQGLPLPTIASVVRLSWNCSHFAALWEMAMQIDQFQSEMSLKICG